MKNLKNNLGKALGIGLIGLASFLPLKSLGQENIIEDFKIFLKENGKLNLDYGYPGYVFEKDDGSDTCNSYLGQIYENENKLMMQLGVQISIVDSITKDNKIYSSKNYFFHDNNADGLDGNDAYNYDKMVRLEKPVLSMNYKIVEHRGDKTWVDFDSLSEETQQKAHKEFDWAMKEIMHQAKYKAY